MASTRPLPMASRREIAPTATSPNERMALAGDSCVGAASNSERKGAASSESAPVKGRAQRNDVRASSIEGVTRPRIKRCGSDATPATRQNSSAKRLRLSSGKAVELENAERRVKAGRLSPGKHRSLLPHQQSQCDHRNRQQHGILE